MSVAVRPPDLSPGVFRLAELCVGRGMLGAGVERGLAALGYGTVPVVAVERDAAAAAAFVARMEDAPVACPPVWDDLATFDGRPWRGVVDCLAAGLPCQPYSLAGKQLGNDDARSHGDDGDGPIPHALRIIAEAQPPIVFFENVPQWVTGGHYEPVGAELHRLGYRRQEAVFVAASDAGGSG